MIAACLASFSESTADPLPYVSTDVNVSKLLLIDLSESSYNFLGGISKSFIVENKISEQK